MAGRREPLFPAPLPLGCQAPWALPGAPLPAGVGTEQKVCLGAGAWEGDVHERNFGPVPLVPACSASARCGEGAGSGRPPPPPAVTKDARGLQLVGLCLCLGLNPLWIPKPPAPPWRRRGLAEPPLRACRRAREKALKSARCPLRSPLSPSCCDEVVAVLSLPLPVPLSARRSLG